MPCAAGLATLATIEDDGLLAKARDLGARLMDEISLLAPVGLIVEVRGRGLLVGVQLAGPVAHDVVLAMLEDGVLATEAGPDVVRFSPPLIVSPEDVDTAAKTFTAGLERVAAAKGLTA